jgi:hypothetical protein
MRGGMRGPCLELKRCSSWKNGEREKTKRKEKILFKAFLKKTCTIESRLAGKVS